MRILGIDPGTATTGFGIIDSQGQKLKFIGGGVITTPAAADMPDRLLTIKREISQVVGEYKPDQMAVELLYFARNSSTAISVGQARGVVLLAAAEASIPVVEFTPLQVKQAVTGYGKATKRQIQEMVQTLLSLSELPRPDDAADALACAIAAAQSVQTP
ncbi:MAG TPA: crossover junction endodeoxyribonuclease RuvC [Candidatus Saccharimonadales bacterium]|nr:crossover junction endodeoxyribonuclease RuvC [Candidatus Saccharimonadales bacterium]